MSDTILIGKAGGPLAWIVVTKGHDEGRMYKLNDDNRLGRDTSCLVKLNDPKVSSSHSCIRFEQGHFVLYDLASKNRTYINGEILSSPQGLMDGDVIGIGDSELVFKQAR